MDYQAGKMRIDNAVQLILRLMPVLAVALMLGGPMAGQAQDATTAQSPAVSGGATSADQSEAPQQASTPSAETDVPKHISAPAVVAARTKLDAAEKAIAQIAKDFEANASDDAKLVEYTLQLEELTQEMIKIGVSLRPRLTEIRARIEALGEPPAEGQPAEPEEAVTERSNLVQERALINSQIGRAEKISIEAEQLIKDINETRRNLFSDTLFDRTAINSEFHAEAQNAFFDEVGNFTRIVRNWFNFAWSFKFQSLMAASFLSSVFALAILLVAVRFFGRLIDRDPDIEDPSYLQRLAVAFWSVAIPTTALLAVFAATYAFFDGFSVLRPDIAAILWALFLALTLVTFVTRVAKAVLAPFDPTWRLINFSNGGAKSVYFNIIAMMAVNGLDFFLGNVSGTLGSPVVLTVAKSFIATIVVGIILVITSRISPVLAETGEHSDPGRPWPKVIKYALVISGIFMIVLSLLGYVGLTRFIAEQILLSSAILAVMYIGFLSGHELMEPGNFAATRMGRFIENNFESNPTRLDRLGVVSGLLVNALALLAGLPLILLQWGFKVQDIQLWAYRLFTDIQIGGISISLSGILVGIVLFMVGLFGTRFFQRWLDGQVLSRSRMDPGVRNSIRTGIGYVGVIIAGIVGVLAAGIDLSSLAIVAGALSLGIGFGLQNIVSNFVSGLILLAERPFKVGDWVETGSTQGFVKRISVRATEIETFQMQSIIVPNSELINGTVGNWNHRNSAARADIEVGVSYSADPEQVMAILEEIALAHDKVLRNPAPAVHFVNFGGSSLDFVLKVYLADVLTGMGIKNDLRVAIFKRFSEEGIEIPFPQTDINFSIKPGAEGAEKLSALPDVTDSRKLSKPKKKVSSARRREGRDEPDENDSEL